MSNNAFVGGIQPGGLTNDFEVKILICYLLEQIGQIMPCNQIYDIFQNTNLVNYFESVEASTELERSGHVKRSINEKKEECLEITNIGLATSRTFSKSIPLTVREKTMDCARELIKEQKKREEIEIKYSKATDGYILSIKMRDVGSDLMNLHFFVPTKEDCIAIRERVYSDPTLLYKGILTILLGSYQEGAVLLAEKADDEHFKNK